VPSLGAANAVMVRQRDKPAVAHAAFLALDRLVIIKPATELHSLEAAPDLMEGRESTREDYFATSAKRGSASHCCEVTKLRRGVERSTQFIVIWGLTDHFRYSRIFPFCILPQCFATLMPNRAWSWHDHCASA
jgi:hypothetical protein